MFSANSEQASIRGTNRRAPGLLPVIFLIFGSVVQAQEFAANAVSRHILTNEGVVALAKAGFDEYFIVERLRTSRTKLDASVEGLISLKEAGLSEDLVREVALQDRRNILAERISLSVYEPTASAPAAPAGSNKVMVEKHWWGFHWVRVSP